ncbi:MAG: hypothetical protein KC420_15495, partial [Myxococcales bacterium]|nr:hypothetical protein [Myxococcales bacterium]
LGEMPFINAAFELARRGDGSGEGEGAERGAAPPEPGLAEVVDLFRRRPPASAPPLVQVPPDRSQDTPATPRLAGRLALFYAICREARGRYERAHGGVLRPGAIAALLGYACRYARVEGDLAPDLYQLVIAGRGFADDNYAQELWEVATTYPWQAEAPEIPALDLSLRDLTARTRNIHLRPRLLRRRRRLMQVVQPRPRERRPGEWAERFSDGICSYPPEDLAIEGFGDQLRRRSASLIAAGQTSTLRFTSSLADGIDVRETIRRWHERTIYVRLDRATRAKAGSVVVIFDDEPLALADLDDDAEPRFPWQMTWQGEGDDEGDMALYATDPFARIVGPGIGRAHYGGFLLSRPAGAMFGVWQDPYFTDARTKAEVLLLAALDHARERIVVYVAARPPRRQLRQIAARMDRKILHVPIGQLAPATIDRLRVFHVLSGPEVRDEAPRYLR